MNTESYTLSQLSRRLCKTQRDDDLRLIERMVKHWTSHDILRTVGEKHTGTGRSRLYTQEEIIVAAYLYELSRYGVTIGDLKVFRKYYDSRMKTSADREALLGGTDKKTKKHGYILFNGVPDKYNVSGFRLIKADQLFDPDLWELDNSDKGRVHEYESVMVINCRALVTRLDLP